MYHILFHSLYSFYASSIKIYVAVTVSCTLTINFISISALLLGPVTKLTQLATSSPARLRSCIIFVACVIRGTIVLFGIRATLLCGRRLIALPLYLLLNKTVVPDSARVISLK